LTCDEHHPTDVIVRDLTRSKFVISLVAVTAMGLAPSAGYAGAEEPIDPPPATTDDEAAAAEFDESALLVDGEAPPPATDVSYDYWGDRWGQSIADVPYRTNPDSTAELIGGFESPVNVGDQYAIRMRTLITPAESGRYRFALSGDDDARLFFNPVGDGPRAAARVAYIAGWTTYRQWDRYASQRAAWFELEAGTPYYAEVIGKEGSGDDCFSVAWELAGQFGLTLVPASVLDSTELGIGGWRTSTPVGLPGVPESLTDPGWSAVRGSESLDVSWASSDGAEWYEVRLEGGGQSVEATVTEPNVAFSNLVPDTRVPTVTGSTASDLIAIDVNVATELVIEVAAQPLVSRSAPIFLWISRLHRLAQ
jgi:hypothetical protein